MGRKILLIEDDRETASYLVRGLGEEGHGVEHVEDGRDGLFRATDGSFDLGHPRPDGAGAGRARPSEGDARGEGRNAGADPLRSRFGE